MLLSDLDLIRLQLRAGFVLDRHGRLLAVNEPNRPPAPRVAIAIARGERVIRVRHDVPEHVARRWLACTDDDELLGRVAAHREVAAEHRGPAFVLPPTGEPGERVVEPGAPGAPPLHPGLVARGWGLSEARPYAGVVRDGYIVAVCYSSRDGVEACEAGVETVSDYRGRGLATVAVRAWAAAVQRSGRVALYSTTWENEASRRVAARLGAEQYAELWRLT